VHTYMYVRVYVLCFCVSVCKTSRLPKWRNSVGTGVHDLEDGQYKRCFWAKRVFSTRTLTTLLATACSPSKILRQDCSVVFFEVPTFLGGFGLQTPPIKRTQRYLPRRYGGRSLKLTTSSDVDINKCRCTLLSLCVFMPWCLNRRRAC
jgi:hypothetical protein